MRGSVHSNARPRTPPVRTTTWISGLLAFAGSACSGADVPTPRFLEHPAPHEGAPRSFAPRAEASSQPAQSGSTLLVRKSDVEYLLGRPNSKYRVLYTDPPVCPGGAV